MGKQDKFLFICTVTLIARAAIEAGVDSELALTLCDNLFKDVNYATKKKVLEISIMNALKSVPKWFLM